MERLTWIIVLCFSAWPVWAVDVTRLSDGTDLSSEIDYLYETPGAETESQVLSRDDWRPLTKANLGYLDRAVWTRLTLTNPGTETLFFVLRNPRPGMDRLDIGVFLSGDSAHHYQLGDLRPADQHPIVHRYTLLPLTLAPGASVMVLTRLENLGPLTANWIFHRIESYSQASARDWLVWGIYGGMIFALMIYNLNLGLSLKRRFFLIYVLAAILSWLIQYDIQGVFRLFNQFLPITGLNYSTWTLPYFLFAALALFGRDFFQTHDTMPNFHYGLKGAVAVLTVCYIMVWLSLIMAPAYRGVGVMLIALGSFSVLVMIILIGIQAIRQKQTGAWLYLLGQAIFALAYLFQIFLLLGWLNWPEVAVQWLIPGATLTEMFLLAGAQSRYLKNLHVKMHRYQLMAVAQSRFSSMGKFIGYAIHQWKTPLARLGALVTELQTFQNYQSCNEFCASCRESLPQLAQAVDTMDRTLLELGDFYRADRFQERFYPALKIKETIDLLAAKADMLSVQVDYRCDYHGEIVGYAQGFVHVLMVLLDNALDIIKERGIESGWIGIRLWKANKHVWLRVEDNGGGVRCQPIQAIFDDFFSHKHSGEANCGLGLSIARLIVQERLHGDLSVRNGSLGACFTLVVPVNVLA